jgi:hypothetical protein
MTVELTAVRKVVYLAPLTVPTMVVLWVHQMVAQRAPCSVDLSAVHLAHQMAVSTALPRVAMKARLKVHKSAA